MFDDRQALCNALSFFYRTMVASAPLLAFAIERSDGALRDYYQQHYAEEVGHDEMLRRDLENLGMKEIPKFHAAAQIAGSQYYLIAHEHPAMLLGYMHALESRTVTPEIADELSKAHGVELTALKHHAEHDPHHKGDLERMIAGLDDELRSLVLWNEQCVHDFLARTLS